MSTNLRIALGAVIVLLLLVLAAVVVLITRSGTSTVDSSASTTTTSPAGPVASTGAPTTATVAAGSSSTASIAPSSSSSGLASTTSPTTSRSTTTSATDPTCVAEGLGLQITYPAGWFTPTQAAFRCLLFDPDPFTVPEQSETPHVAVAVVQMQGSYDAEVARLRGAPFDTIVAEQDFTLGGRHTTCFTLSASGEALLEAGTRTYLCISDFDGVAIGFENVSPSGASDDSHDAHVRQIADNAVVIV